MADIQVSRESWVQAEADIRRLAPLHFAEMNPVPDPRRPFSPDWDMFSQLDKIGMLVLLVARPPGDWALGYLAWTLAPDFESRGLLLAVQGAWYVSPGKPGLAVRLFDESLTVLKALGAGQIYLNQVVDSPRAGFGRFYSRRGAKLTGYQYQLWLED